MIPPDADADAPLPQRIALLSIVGFWAFYLTILTGRALFIYRAHVGFLNRLLVSLASIALTYLFYLLLRRVTIAHLRRAIVAAALLAAPAALAYAAINWAIFSRDMPQAGSGGRSRIVIVRTPPPAVPAIPSSGTVPAPPAPPAPPQTITVGKMDEEESFSPLTAIADQAANGYFFFICWAALYLALRYAHQVRSLERRAAALAAAAQAAELRALRYQVNPHFLFNTLNSLSSLVLGNKRDQAEQVILNLATFFRTSLAADTTADVPLAEEIRLQRLYLDIERVRFPDRLSVVIDVPDALQSACVPGLLLQPLVENAIKHGVARAREPVTIRIVAREAWGRLELCVEDDAVALSPVPDPVGTGIGLRNVRDRLAARFGVESACEWGPGAGGGFSVRMALPLVRHDC